MAEVDDSTECQYSVQFIQDVLPNADFFGSVNSTTLPRGCHYRVSTLQKNVFWNRNSERPHCSICRNICKGKLSNIIS